MPTSDQLYDEAVALKEKGETDAAIAKLHESVELDANNPLSHGLLAKLYADIAEADKAVYHAKRVVEIDPEDVFSYTALSVIYMRCGMIPEAEHAKAVAYRKEHGLDD